MSDTAYDNARIRRDESARLINQLQEELDRLRREHARAERFMADWEEFSRSRTIPEHTENTRDDSITETVDKSARSPVSNPPKETIGEFARDLIRGKNAPVTRNGLFLALQLAGITLQGTDPKMVLSTMMWRMSKPGDPFVRLGKLGYWLADQDYEPAGYKANSRLEEQGKVNAAEDLVMEIGDRTGQLAQYEEPEQEAAE